MKAGLLITVVILLLGALAPPLAALPQTTTAEPGDPIVEPAHIDTDPENAADRNREDSPLTESLRELATPIQVMLLLSLLVFLPAALLTLTSYTRIIIVLAFVRRAIGAQELPPNPILVGISLFLTAAVMAPTFGRVDEAAIQPFLEQNMSLPDALSASADEIKTFMMRHTREDDLVLALQLAQKERPRDVASTPFTVAVPAFVLSELRTAFRMGFIVYLPFVLIDLVVASVLLSLGMFMLPPTMIAMPLKILLFVLVDGWALTVQSLTLSFGIS